jgi:hypothetical protein
MLTIQQIQAQAKRERATAAEHVRRATALEALARRPSCHCECSWLVPRRKTGSLHTDAAVLQHEMFCERA